MLKNPISCTYACIGMFEKISLLTQGPVRHEILFHLDERRNNMRKNRGAKKVTENSKECVCKFKLENGAMCGHKATSYHYLRKHKDEEGHKRYTLCDDCINRGDILI